MAWPRLAEYFARFRLSLGIPCSLEVMATTLSRLPLSVRPPQEEQSSLRRLSISSSQNNNDRYDQEDTTNPQKDEDKKDTENADHNDEELWGNGFEDDQEQDDENENRDTARGNQSSQVASQSQRSTSSNRNSNNRAAIVSPLLVDHQQQQQQQQTARLQTQHSKEQQKEEMRKNMHRAVELYLGRPVEFANVAHSKQPIRVRSNTTRTDNNSTRQRTRKRTGNNGPQLEVSFVVIGPSAQDSSDNDDEQEEDDSTTSRSGNTFGAAEKESRYSSGGDSDEDDESNRHSGRNNDNIPVCATMMMIRMVNQIPLLDGSEASSCGLIQGLLLKKKMWNSFGLEVSSNGLLLHRRHAVGGKEKSIPQLPTFQVRDSDQVAPFFRSTNHSVFQEDSTSDEESEEDEDSQNGFEEGYPSRRKRRRNRRKKLLLPAQIRLGNILVIVQIDAEPSSLPLPTLSKVCFLFSIALFPNLHDRFSFTYTKSCPLPSFLLLLKGRLPTDNSAIDKAFEVAILECLRSLQKTSPELLLTAQQLKKVERDARYVPAVASSLATIIAKSKNIEFRERMANVINHWDGDVEEGCEEGEDDDVVRDDGARQSQDSNANYSQDDDDAEIQERTLSNRASGTDSDSDSGDGDDDNKLMQILGEKLETRLRQVVAAHDETPRKRGNRKGRSNKVARQDGDEDNTGKAATAGEDENSLVSFNFSATSASEPDHEARPPHRRARSISSLESQQSIRDINGFDSESEASRQREVDAEDPRNKSASPQQNNVLDDDDDDDWWPV